jgi:phage tail-like protein
MSDLDPFISYHFKVDIPKLKDMAYFTEVSGLEMKVPAIKSVTVMPDGKRVLRQLPGDGLEYSDIVLKRAVTDDITIWTWRQEVEEGKIVSARCNGTISMVDPAGKVVASWEFTSGWPSKISGPTLNAGSDDVSIEEVTIVHEGLKRTL